MPFGLIGFSWMAFLLLCVCEQVETWPQAHRFNRQVLGHMMAQQPASPHSVVSHQTLAENVSSIPAALHALWWQSEHVNLSSADGNVRSDAAAQASHTIKTTTDSFCLLSPVSILSFSLCASFVLLCKIMNGWKQSNSDVRTHFVGCVYDIWNCHYWSHMCLSNY